MTDIDKVRKTNGKLGKMYAGQVGGTKISAEIKKMMGSRGLGKGKRKASKKSTYSSFKI